MKSLLSSLLVFILAVPSVVLGAKISMPDLVKRNKRYYKKFSNTPYDGNVHGPIQSQILRRRQTGKHHAMVFPVQSHRPKRFVQTSLENNGAVSPRQPNKHEFTVPYLIGNRGPKTIVLWQILLKRLTAQKENAVFETQLRHLVRDRLGIGLGLGLGWVRVGLGLGLGSG